MEFERSPSGVREKSEGSPLMLFSSSARTVLGLSSDHPRTTYRLLGLYLDSARTLRTVLR